MHKSGFQRSLLIRIFITFFFGPWLNRALCKNCIKDPTKQEHYSWIQLWEDFSIKNWTVETAERRLLTRNWPNDTPWSMIISIRIKQFSSDGRWSKSSYTSHRVCNTQCMRDMRRTDIIQICFWCWKLESHKCLKKHFSFVSSKHSDVNLCYYSESNNGNDVTSHGKIEKAKSSRENWSTAV